MNGFFSKIFPLFLHIIVAAVAVGIAVGAHAEGVRPLIQFPLNGLAAGLGITAVFRLFVAAVA